MNMRLLTHILIFLTISFHAERVRAQEGSSTSVHSTNKVLTTMNVFYYGDTNDQGGKELPGGSTMLSSLSLQYILSQYYTGIGLFTHIDKIGESQSNSATGLKLDFFAPTLPYYIEYGLAFAAEQTFTNRAVKSRSGTMSFMGLGVRVPLTSWLFFDGNFKQRQWTFDKEDGVGLSNPVHKQERIPYLGFGVAIKLNGGSGT